MIDVKKLQTRKLEEKEVSTVVGNAEKGAIIEWLADQLRDVQINDGLEIGPFDDQQTASNFHHYYIPDTTKSLGWGSKEKVGRQVLRSKVQVREKDGKFYLWVVRRG